MVWQRGARCFLTLTNEVFSNCFIQHLKLKRLLVSPSFIAINTLRFLIPLFFILFFYFEFYTHSPRHVSSKVAPLRTQYNFMSSSCRRTVNFMMLACCCIPPHGIACEMCTYSVSRKWHRKREEEKLSFDEMVMLWKHHQHFPRA